MRVQDSVALVTGASSGIGRATARCLAASGARLVVSGRDPDRTRQVAEETGGEALVCDLAQPEAAAALAERASAVHGRVDLLVASAGTGWSGPFTQMSPGQIDALVALDLLAPLQLSRAVLPGMLARGRGHLALVGSVAGATGVAGEAVYSAAKAGLEMFADSLALELSGTRVGVSLTVPGAVRTSFFDNRGRAYGRSRPAPVPPETVARALVAAVRHDRAQAWVPRWLRVAPLVRAVAPGAYRRLSARYGEQVRCRAAEEVEQP